MSCCKESIFSFVNQATTSVGYTGAKPTIQVLYLQPDGSFVQSGIFTQIQITATDIIIDHGGLATGTVKLLQ